MRLSLLDTTLLSNFAHAGRPDLLRLVLGETPNGNDSCEVNKYEAAFPGRGWLKNAKNLASPSQ